MGVADAGLTIVGAHATATVDQQHDALVTGILELPDNGLAEAQRSLPVDPTYRVADAILGELLEVCSGAAAPVGLDANLGEAPVSGQPRVACHLREVRIDASHPGITERFQQLAESEPRPDPYVSRREGYLAAAGGSDPIGEGHTLAAADRQRGGQSFRLQTRIGVIVNRDVPTQGPDTLDDQIDIPFHADSQCRGHHAGHAGRRLQPCLSCEPIIGSGCRANQDDPCGCRPCSQSDRDSHNQRDQQAHRARCNGSKCGWSRDDAYAHEAYQARGAGTDSTTALSKSAGLRPSSRASGVNATR